MSLDSDPLLDWKRIEVQSSTDCAMANPLRNGLVLCDRRLCLGRLATFGDCVKDGRRQSRSQSKNEHGKPHLFLSHFQD